MKKWKGILSGLLSATMMMSLAMPSLALTMDGEDESTKFKIASYNIAAKGNSTKAISELIGNDGIDVVGFQEVDKNTGRNPKDMLKEIADEIGYDHYFKKNIDYSGGEYGIGIVAKGTLSNQSGENLASGSYEGNAGR